MEKQMEKPKTVAVIGGGAAGLMCACLAARGGAAITLFEKNPSEKFRESDVCFDNAYLGKKLLITGKGRCNVTNACTRETFLNNVPVNPKFLYAAYSAFPSEETVRFFESAGVKLKTERGNRVFPVSDKSQDVLNAFKKVLREQHVRVVNKEIRGVEKTSDGFLLSRADGVTESFDACVVATGGLSYPVTGSTGDGYVFAERFGHTVTERKPSLVPLVCSEEAFCRTLSGLSLKNVTLSLRDEKKKKDVYRELGEMLFCHFGVSGPLVLSASAHMKPFAEGDYTLHIDMKPALDEQTLDRNLVKKFEEAPNRKLSHVLEAFLPKSMTAPFAVLAGLSPDTLPNGITKEQRRTLAHTFKDVPLTVKAFRPIEEAVITSGGVSVKEINPATMESKLVPGLYFVGEVLDVDAYTGGFNLQIAFCTAASAARAVTASGKEIGI